jgi:hypothetical protein
MPSATPGLVKFALRTSDTAWIARNDGLTGDDGRTTILIPAAVVERVTILGTRMLRTTLADCPSDFARLALCPAAWVE